MPEFIPEGIEDRWLARENAEFMGWLRICPDCDRRDLWLMEVGEWICHSCGHVADELRGELAGVSVNHFDLPDDWVGPHPWKCGWCGHRNEHAGVICEQCSRYGQPPRECFHELVRANKELRQRLSDTETMMDEYVRRAVAAERKLAG